MLTTSNSADFTSVTSAYNALKKSFIRVLLDLQNRLPHEVDEELENLAFLLEKTSAYMRKAFDGMVLLSSMPSLLEEVLADATFDADRLAAIVSQSRKFDHLEPPEVETILRHILSNSHRCPSPSSIAAAIRKGNYKQSRRSVSQPQPSTKPQQNLYYDESTGTATISLDCTNEQFQLIARLLSSDSLERNVSIHDSLLHLLQGKKRARIRILAIDLPGERVYVEGVGWMDKKKFYSTDSYLHEKVAISPEELVEKLMNIRA